MQRLEMEGGTNRPILRLLWNKKCLGMWQLLVSVLFLGFTVAQPHSSQPYCFTDDTDPYHQFATKTPYNYSRGHFSSLDLVPEGELWNENTVCNHNICCKLCL